MSEDWLKSFTVQACCDEYNQVYDDDGELIYRRSCDCICHCPEGDDDLRWPDE